MTAAVVIKYAIELVAVLLLALGIKGLSKVRSARAANQLAAVAMALAVLGVLINFLSTSGSFGSTPQALNCTVTETPNPKARSVILGSFATPR